MRTIGTDLNRSVYKRALVLNDKAFLNRHQSYNVKD